MPQIQDHDNTTALTSMMISVDMHETGFIQRSPPLDMPPNRKKGFQFMTAKDRSVSTSSEGSGDSVVGTGGRANSRASCRHCNAIFFPAFSAAGQEHCGMDCRTMDRVYGDILRARGVTGFRKSIQPNTSAVNEDEEKSGKGKKQNDEKNMFSRRVKSPIVQPVTVVSRSHMSHTVPPSPIKVARAQPDWSSSPPETKKRSKSFATAGAAMVDIPAYEKSPSQGALLRKHSGLSLVLQNDAQQVLPPMSPLSLRPAVVSLDDVASLDLRDKSGLKAC